MLLWSELQRDSGFSNALVKLSDQITYLTGASTGRVLEQLKTTPLVFVAPSWIPSIEEADLATHSGGTMRAVFVFIRTVSQPRRISGFASVRRRLTIR
jgi:hypothetical protein